MKDAFAKAMTEGYTFDQPTLVLGSPMYEGELFNGAHVQVPLAMMNRHGLIAGCQEAAIFPLLPGVEPEEGQGTGQGHHADSRDNRAIHVGNGNRYPPGNHWSLPGSNVSRGRC